jgi:trehalose-phosphatase
MPLTRARDEGLAPLGGVRGWRGRLVIEAAWLAEAAQAARTGRLGVLTDFDGTISALAPRPDLAVLDPGCGAALAALRPLVPLVGVISGRELDELRALVGLPGLFYSGSHGLSTWYEGVEEVEPGAAALRDLVGPAEADLAAALRGRRVLFERKRFGLAVHYREDPDPDAARFAILEAIGRSAAAAAFVVREGARVVELVPPLGVSKGMALRGAVERFRLDGLVFFGDDRTDADAFTALHDLRAAGRIRGWAVAAVHPETAAEVLTEADAAVPSVTGVTAALTALVGRLTR